MKELLLKALIKLRILAISDHGQDLVEYALLAAVLALSAIAGMHSVAVSISTVFSTIGAMMTSNVT